MLSPCLVFKEEVGEKTSIGEMLVEKLPVFVQSADLEVQERVSGSYHVFFGNEQKKIWIIKANLSKEDTYLVFVSISGDSTVLPNQVKPGCT